MTGKPCAVCGAESLGTLDVDHSAYHQPQPMTRERLQALIRGRIEPSAIVTDFTESEPGTGIVAWVRDVDYEPFVTHRWATLDTAGNPIIGDSFMLWIDEAAQAEAVRLWDIVGPDPLLSQLQRAQEVEDERPNPDDPDDDR